LKTHWALLHPQRLGGAHETIRVDFTLYDPKTFAVLRLAQPTRLADVLAFIARTGQPGIASYLHKRENDHPAVSVWRPGEMAKKRGGYRHQHGPIVLPSFAA
jgi:hypothetical protein